jgi:5S rRNA maturation endonuclease (ribonuclease M5)
MKTYSEIILVESVIDALSVITAGRRNVIAVQGTNGLNDAEIAMLREHGVQNVTLLLDGDEPGRKAAERLKGKLSSFSCRALTLPDNHDPNSFLTERGAAKLAETLNHAAESGPRASTVRAGGGDGQTPSTSGGLALTIGIRRYEIRGLEKGPRKLKVALRIEHAGKLHVDTLDLYSARSRKMLAMDLCRMFDETPETVEADIAKLMKFCETARPADEGKAADPAQTLSIRDRQEAEAFGKSPPERRTALARDRRPADLRAGHPHHAAAARPRRGPAADLTARAAARVRDAHASARRAPGANPTPVGSRRLDYAQPISPAHDPGYSQDARREQTGTVNP